MNPALALHHNAPLLMSMGEAGGIGPELAMQIWRERHQNQAPAFALVASRSFLEKRAQRMGLAIPIETLDPNAASSPVASIFKERLPVFDLSEPVNDQPGIADPKNAAAVIAAITFSIRMIREQRASALITCPIHKKSLYDAGFSYPGHTEYLAELANQWAGAPYRAVMMLAGPQLRTVPATVHIPLKDVPAALDTRDLIELISITHRALQMRFALDHPRLVVTGLNPHAGEEGAMGDEEDRIIRPAIAACRKAGIHVSGPHPADTLFHPERRACYDAAIAMYHDQALLPVKTIAFDETVNVTLGLPFIRTSPDHGTALDIAGQGIARPASLLAALKMARTMVDHAQEVSLTPSAFSPMNHADD